MILTGISDEAGQQLSSQIKATKALNWEYLELRHINGKNLAEMDTEDFISLRRTLDREGLKISCYASSIANWGKDPFNAQDRADSLEELRKALPRMKELDISFIRGMSFSRQNLTEENRIEAETLIFPALREMARLCDENGIIYLHENCMNYGGMSPNHTLRLIDAVNNPSFRLLFDTGNPVITDDCRLDQKGRKQNSLEFFRAVKEHVSYIHIKDGIYEGENGTVFPDARWTYPGEGQGCIKEILKELADDGYKGFLSIEPHMATQFHGGLSGRNDQIEPYDNYIEYGRRLMTMIGEL